MRLWPRSMTGQLMLAVALALLVVQGLGSVLVYRAQYERREAEFVNAAAFRIAMEVRGKSSSFARERPQRRRFGSKHHPFGRFRMMHSTQSPERPGEYRDPVAERLLARILTERDIAVSQVVVIHRDAQDDPPALARAARRAAFMGAIRKCRKVRS